MGTDPSADPGVVSEERAVVSAAAHLPRLQHQSAKSQGVWGTGPPEVAQEPVFHYTNPTPDLPFHAEPRQTTQSHRFRLTPWLLMGCVALAAATACWPHSGVVQADGRFHEGIRFLVCLGIGSLLVLFYPHDSAMLRFRTVRTLARVGTISYSLYLTHVLIGTRVFNLGARVTGLDEVWWLVYAALSFASAMLIGSVFFRYCEEPWLGSPLRRPTKELSTVQFQSQS